MKTNYNFNMFCSVNYLMLTCSEIAEEVCGVCVPTVGRGIPSEKRMCNENEINGRNVIVDDLD